MKLTKSKLKRLIKEELQNLYEQPNPMDCAYDILEKAKSDIFGRCKSPGLGVRIASANDAKNLKLVLTVVAPRPGG